METIQRLRTQLKLSLPEKERFDLIQQLINHDEDLAFDELKEFISKLKELSILIKDPVYTANAEQEYVKILIAETKYEEALSLTENLINQSKDWNNKSIYLGALLNRSQIYRKFNKEEESSTYTKEALEETLKYNYPKKQIEAYLQLSNIFKVFDKNEKSSIEILFKALALAEKNNFKKLTGIIYHEIGNNKSIPKKSRLQYFETAINIFREVKAYKRIPPVLRIQAYYCFLESKWDEGIELINEAYRIARSKKYKTFEFLSCFYGIRYISTLVHFSKTLNNKSKIEILDKVNDWAEKLNQIIPTLHDPNMISVGYFGKAWYYFALGNYDQVLVFVDKAEKSIELVEKDEGFQRDLAHISFLTYQKKEDYKNAFEKYAIFHKHEKKFWDENNAKQAAELEKKYQTKEREAELARLEQMEELKTRFFSQITHELRTPLTLIKGPAEQILNKTKEVEIANNAILIKNNANRLLMIVNQLLDLNKLEAGKMALKNNAGFLGLFIESLIDAFQFQAKLKEIQLDFFCNDENSLLNFDSDKIEKILFNLISNAIKFTPPQGRISCHLNFNTSEKDNVSLIELTVQDTGKGISEEQLPYIFDRFYQADNSLTRENEGTGIGLSLVKELIELLNGEINVKSSLNKGTTFFLNFPLTIGEENEEDIYFSSNKSPKVNTEFYETLIPANQKTEVKVPNKKYPLLLLIEDNLDLHQFIKSIFSDNYLIIQAFDGEQGKQMALDRIPDIIISDVMMPKKNGYQVCEELKNEVSTSHIPIVLLTAKSALDSRIEGLEVGADAYLAKPFSSEELKLQIKNLLSTRENFQRKNKKYLNSLLPEDKDTGKEDNFLKLVINIIDKNIENTEFSVRTLSNKVNLSHSQFYRKMQALTDLTPSQFMRNFRLAKGKSLLENNGGNISEISYKIGLSPRYFTQSFFKVYGFNPSKLLK